jgi:uncharacterized repeat protein (TIGR02543 family)
MKKVYQLILILSLLFTLNACHLFESNDGPFAVTFDSNGGTAVETIYVDQFKPFLPTTIPQKDGYVFAGWYIDKDLYYPMSFQTGTNQTLKLYAKWIAVGSSIDQQAIIDHILANIDLVTVLESHVVTMLEEVSPAVVMIETYQGGTVDGGGSGVIYKRDGNTYYVLTNEHVVSGYVTGQFSITLFTPTGEVKIPKHQVTLHKSSITHDLAVLSFTSTQNFSVIEMADVDDLHVGEFVFAIGSPLDLPNTRTFGIISQLNRPMADDYGLNTLTIQHTAPINPGNSGGALVDIYGRLVGINALSYVDETVGEGIEGLHFAIQIDVIKSVLDGLE